MLRPARDRDDGLYRGTSDAPDNAKCVTAPPQFRTLSGQIGGVCLQLSGAGADRVADEIDGNMDRGDQ